MQMKLREQQDEKESGSVKLHNKREGEYLVQM